MLPELVLAALLALPVVFLIVPGARWWLLGIAALIAALALRGASVARAGERRHPFIAEG
jgi:hypothetical protein